MKRSSPAVVIAWAIVGAIGGFLLQTGLAAAGSARLQLPWTLALSIAVLAVALVLLAIPVWRSTHGKSERRVDPFAAARTVVLAKAGAVLGAIFLGVSTGFMADVLLRPVIAEGDLVARSLATVGASVLLLVGGLVAEQLCVVPPGSDPDDDDPQAPAGAR